MKPEKASPDSVKQLQRQLEKASNEVAAFKYTCLLQQEQLQRDPAPSHVQHLEANVETVDETADRIATGLRTFWLLGLMCMMAAHILFE